MSNFKRKKSRKQIRCQLCTDNRNGNSLKWKSKEDLKKILRKLKQMEQENDYNQG